MRVLARSLLTLALASAILLAQPLPRGADAFLPEKLAHIKTSMQAFVDEGAAVSMIVKDGKVARLEAEKFVIKKSRFA